MSLLENIYLYDCKGNSLKKVSCKEKLIDITRHDKQTCVYIISMACDFKLLAKFGLLKCNISISRGDKDLLSGYSSRGKAVQQI